MLPYQSLPSPTFQTEFDEVVELDEDFDAGGYFSDYFEAPQADFQGPHFTNKIKESFIIFGKCTGYIILAQMEAKKIVLVNTLYNQRLSFKQLFHVLTLHFK